MDDRPLEEFASLFIQVTELLGAAGSDPSGSMLLVDADRSLKLIGAINGALLDAGWRWDSPEAVALQASGESSPEDDEPEGDLWSDKSSIWDDSGN